jgi:hypothetical protein
MWKLKCREREERAQEQRRKILRENLLTIHEHVRELRERLKILETKPSTDQKVRSRMLSVAGISTSGFSLT